MPVLRGSARGRGAHLPARERLPALTLTGALEAADLTVVGRITPASNLAFLVEVCGTGSYAIYKPVSGERPLWDFPDGTLAGRERAAYLVSEAGGFGLVPQTVLRDGPVGVGSVQRWVGEPAEPLGEVVDIVLRAQLTPGWVVGFEAEDLVGREVVVAHRDSPAVRSMAVLDVVLNNTDRKGGHLALDAAGRLWGFDHGLVCHAEPKLRTVLWGFAGEPLAAEDVARLGSLRAALDGPLLPELSTLLTTEEVEALTRRTDRLLAAGLHPHPPRHRYGIPWPPV